MLAPGFRNKEYRWVVAKLFYVRMGENDRQSVHSQRSARRLQDSLPLHTPLVSDCPPRLSGGLELWPYILDLLPKVAVEEVTDCTMPCLSSIVFFLVPKRQNVLF